MYLFLVLPEIKSSNFKEALFDITDSANFFVRPSVGFIFLKSFEIRRLGR